MIKYGISKAEEYEKYMSKVKELLDLFASSKKILEGKSFDSLNTVEKHFIFNAVVTGVKGIKPLFFEEYENAYAKHEDDKANLKWFEITDKEFMVRGEKEKLFVSGPVLTSSDFYNRNEITSMELTELFNQGFIITEVAKNEDGVIVRFDNPEYITYPLPVLNFKKELETKSVDFKLYYSQHENLFSSFMKSYDATFFAGLISQLNINVEQNLNNSEKGLKTTLEKIEDKTLPKGDRNSLLREAELRKRKVKVLKELKNHMQNQNENLPTK